METNQVCPPAVRDAIIGARAALERASVRSPTDLGFATEAAEIMGGLTESTELANAVLARPVISRGLTPEQTAGIVGQGATDIAVALQRLGTLGLPRDWSPSRGLDARQAETLRKMLLAVVSDPRLVLARLAEELVGLRHARELGAAERERRAVEARVIYAPLANRLGVWQLKWELEDLALRVLEPEVYQNIARMLDEKRDARETYIADLVGQLRAELARAGIRAEVSGRPKHIHSIYSKMQRKGVAFDALYDVRAVRVLVGDIKECYAALGVVHNLWAPLAKEFDDYIAKPKSNDYRSLHTAVIGPEGKPVEIQIRTFEMHQHAELGVAAHWRYKEGARHDAGYGEKIAWLRQIVDWKDDIADAGELAAQFRSELFADTIYVLTPQGRVIDLPHDATPIDFAYHVHSELGHRCRGARVDGAMVPLSTPLRNGQQVEIVAAKQGGPSRDWLNPALGFLKSAGARAKVRQWFNRQNFDADVAQGRELVEKELQRYGMTGVGLDKLAQRFAYDKTDDFLAEVGRGAIGARQLQQALRVDAAPPVATPAHPVVRQSRAQPGGILVVGVDKLLTVPAKCCKPAPPDPIIGFVTRGRGVTIHRKSCVNLARLASERVVPADWGQSAGATFPVDVVIEAGDRTGLLRDITEILSRERINITATNTVRRDLAARIVLTVEIGDVEQLNRVLALIRDVRGVARAARR